VREGIRLAQHRLNDGIRTLGKVLLAGGALVAAASCGGGGSSSPPLAVTPTATPGAKTSSASVRFVITWPQKATSSAIHRRRPEYLSNATASITIVVAGTTTVVNNPNLSPGAGSAGTQSSTVVNVSAPVGADTFLVSDYDAASGAGNLLAQNSIPFTVVIDTANTVSVTLNGNLAKIACAPIGPFVYGTGSFTLVGPAGQIALLPEDADSNIIIAPGNIPKLTLTSVDTTKATVAPTSTLNEFTVNVLASGVEASLTGAGTNLAGVAVPTTTCSVSRVEALYVANQGPYGAAKPSVTIYPATASGDATPTATLVGSKTNQVQIQFLAVDSAGNLFVSNEGPEPGATFAPTSGFVNVYGPGVGQSGNAAPIATITNLDEPEGVAVDTSNNLYVLSIDRIQIYPASADGVTAAAVPMATITGSNTGLNSDYGLSVGLDGTMYAAGVNDILSQGKIDIFAKGSTGNVAPIIIEPPGSMIASGIPSESQSWLDVAPDSTGKFYTAASNNNLNLVDGYAAQTASGTPTPSLIATGTGFSQPTGIFVDIFGTTPANSIYVGNYGANSVLYFSSSTILQTGLATSTLSGADTGLNNPYGIYVR